MAKIKKCISPAKATAKQLLKMHSDHYELSDFWIVSDSFTVTLAERKVGKFAGNIISIPRHKFNKLIAWYFKEQELKDD